KDLMAAVLAPLGEVVAPPGSFNNELGHPWTVLHVDQGPDGRRAGPAGGGGGPARIVQQRAGSPVDGAA
ncbi:hypothetical protein GR254_25255, partial [Mycobacterium tuberculosis]|nr:hypothetical protein [Mycobacterium tuberculosis]